MAKTVDEGFRIFHGWLTPTGGESSAAQKHRASIEACLKINFQMNRFFRTGSFGNGTSISGYSDVDYFASIPTGNLKQNSATTLRVVKDALDIRFPNTGVVVKSPAILVPFGISVAEWTEVVPADYKRKDKYGHSVYEIADGNGDWMEASPEAHNAYVAAINDKLDKKVKPLVRFIKAWKYYRNVPISSFYLELRTAKYASSEKSIVYSIDVKNVLKALWDCQLAAMQDPMGISGYIYSCTSDANKKDALSKLATALARAEKAREAERNDNIADAFYWWNLVFAELFPLYL